jgi:hypothetical protein
MNYNDNLLESTLKLERVGSNITQFRKKITRKLAETS